MEAFLQARTGFRWVLVSGDFRRFPAFLDVGLFPCPLGILVGLLGLHTVDRVVVEARAFRWRRMIEVS